jgi:CRP-like cAMP-binding protein
VGSYLELAPRLLAFLAWREERRVARNALAQLGDRVMPRLEVLLNDRAEPLELRLQLPRVMRMIGTPDALHALLFSAGNDDASLHYRIGAEMSRLRDEHSEYSVDVARVRQALGRRRDTYHALVGPFRDLRVALGDSSLLTRAVGGRLDQALELSFFLLGLLYTPHTMRRVHQHLVGHEPRRKAYALELMDAVVAQEDRELVIEQVEGYHRELPPGALGKLEVQLEMLVQSEDVVLRACARYVARRLSTLVVPPLQESDMSETTVQKMFALEGVSVFSQSDVDDIAAVAAVAKEVRFRAGERIYSQGDPGDALYVIVEGVVDHFRDGEHVLRSQAKETFGDVSLLDGAPRPTDVAAVEETRVLVIDRRDFLDLLADRPELLTGFFRAVSQQLRTLIDLPATRQSGELLEVGHQQSESAPPITEEVRLGKV